MTAAGTYVNSLAEALEIQADVTNQDDPKEESCPECGYDMEEDGNEDMWCPACARNNMTRSDWDEVRGDLQFHEDR